MGGELESVRQQVLEHFRNLVLRCTLRERCLDVESWGPNGHHPIRPYDTVRRETKDIADQHRQICAFEVDSLSLHLHRRWATAASASGAAHACSAGGGPAEN